MRLSSFLLSTALVAGCLSLSPSKAEAREGAFLLPQTAWTIAQFEGKEGAADNGYCAIARRYDQNIILTIAKNAKGESSIAVDFQKRRFNPNNTLALTLNAGGGIKRSFTIKPVSDQAFVVRLGKDQAFFDALEQNGVLHAQIGNRSFSFNAADAGAGTGQLVGCVSALSGDMIADAKAADVTFLNEPDYNAEMAAYEEDILALREENVLAVQDETSMDGQSLMAVDAQRTDISAEQRLAELERVNAKLSEALVLAQSHIRKKVSGDPQSKLEAYEMMKKENDRLRAALLNASKGQQSTDLLEDQLAQALDKNETLAARLAGLEAKLSSAQMALEISEASDVQSQELEARIATLRDDRDNALRQMAEIKAQNESLQKMVSETTDLQAQSKAVAERLDYLAAELSSKEQELLDLKKVSDDVDLVREENKNLRQQILSAAYKNAGSVEEQKALVAQLEAENEKIRSRMQEMAAEAEKGLSAVRQKEILEEELAALKRENEALQKKIDVAQSDSVQTFLDESESEIIVAEIADAVSMDSQDAVTDVSDIFAPQDISEGADNAENVNQMIERSMELKPMEMPGAVAELEKGKVQAVDRYALPEQGDVSDLQISPVLYIDSTGQKVNADARVADDVLPADYFEAIAEQITFNQSEDERKGGVDVPEHGGDDLAWAEAVLADMDQEFAGDKEASANPVNMTPAQSSLSVMDVLTRAAIVPEESIKASVDEQESVYEWGVGNVRGYAAQTALADVQAFDTQVQGYLEQAEAECAGEFAIVPDLTTSENGLRVDVYELACVKGSGAGESASLVFVSQGQDFAAVSHQGTTEDMDQVMEMRDRILAVLKEG